jgi:hypothetical protein
MGGWVWVGGGGDGKQLTDQRHPAPRLCSSLPQPSLRDSVTPSDGAMQLATHVSRVLLPTTMTMRLWPEP